MNTPANPRVLSEHHYQGLRAIHAELQALSDLCDQAERAPVMVLLGGIENRLSVLLDAIREARP